MTLDGYRYVLPVTVRFADLDAMGHLNNVTYLTYAEQARITYMRDVIGWQGDWRKLGMILARTEIDYKLPVGFGDTVTVPIRVSRIGSKSFDFEALVLRQRGESEAQIAAAITAVMVAYDYQREAAIPLPDSWRERMVAYEPALQATGD